MDIRTFLRVTTFALFSVSGALAQCNSNDPSAPCFATNADILNGRNNLLQDDDILTAFRAVFSSNPPGTFINAGYALTANSGIVSGLEMNVEGLGAGPSSNAITTRARLYATPFDEVFSAVNYAQGKNAFLEGPNFNGCCVNQFPSVFEIPFLQQAQQLYGVAGDFLGTGFDQIVVGALQFNAPLKQTVFEVVQAKDPYNGAKGLKWGPTSSPFNNASSLYAMASGVFTEPAAGGRKPAPQIALLSTNPATGNGLTLTFFSVNSSAIVVPTGKALNLTLPEGNSAAMQTFALASGRFAGTGHDQLVIAYVAQPPQTAKLITVDFDPQGNPVQEVTYDTKVTVNTPASAPYPVSAGVFLRGGRLDWYSQAEQAVFSLFTANTNSQGSRLEVVTFDDAMNPTEGTPYTYSGGCHLGLAVGRFDRMQSNPNPPPAQEPNPNLQIADLSGECGTTDNTFNLNFFNIDLAHNFAVTAAGGAPSFFEGCDPSCGVDLSVPPSIAVSMVAADTQGRSLPLGQPEKATVASHIQPDTVLGVPPMHVDWITPAGGSAPEVLNVSVFPATFNTSYSFQSGQNGTVSRTGTTSYTAGTKENASEKVSYGVPGIASVSVQSTQAASQLHQNSVAKKYNTYSGQTSGFSTKTMFDDVVAATASQMNIYSYRVLGQCATAAGAPGQEGCAPGTKPVYIQFSGPDNVNYIQAAEGRNLEWYQPVQEPGNLFSYPANLQQLQANIAGGNSLQPLTPTNNLWDSQTATAVVANWTQGGGNSVTSGSTSTHTFDASVSVSGSVSFEGFGASASVGFAYNQSSSTSTLNESTSSVSSSQGITLNRGVGGGPISSSTYDYQGQSFIFGQKAPQGTIQTDATPNTTVQAQGYIAAAHVADMVSQGSITSGNFWPQAYGSAPDIALNHPQRWLQKTPSGVNPQQVQFNCPIGYTSSLSSPECTAVSQSPTPANVADAPFYQMKGLFVTPGGTTDGPQITETALGTKVNLRARVYNYSLANFPAGSVMHVQFYAQPWGAGEFASAPGNPNQFAPAIFIGEGTDSSGNPLPPVRAFCGGYSGGADPCVDSTVQNWEFAYATWDTSKNNVTANSTWKFWVVAWVEYNGKLMQEIPGHGLTAMPTAPFNSLADVPVETYSNNLGFYNQVFTVLAPQSVGSGPGKKKHLRLEQITLPGGKRLLRDEPAVVKASHRAMGDQVRNLLTLYYDGDPSRGGTLFDTQSISRVPADGVFVDRALYTPKTCGEHELFVQAIPADGSAKPATARKRVEVTIDPVESLDQLIAYVRKLQVPEALREEAIAYLRGTRHEFQQGEIEEGRSRMKRLVEEVREHRWPVPEAVEDVVVEHAEDLLHCVRAGHDHDRDTDGD